MNDHDEGFVIFVNPYREHDAMVYFLGERFGLIRFIIAGYYKSSSKQISLGLEFSKVRYSFNYKPDKLNRIVHGQLLDSYRGFREQYQWLLHMSLACEIIRKCYEEDFHPHIYRFINELALISNPDASVQCMIAFLVRLIRHVGFVPQVDQCVKCNSKKINQFSIREGGFLCVDHALSRSDSKELLKSIRLLFRQDFGNNGTGDTVRNSSEVLRTLVEYIQFHTDNNFNSFKLFSDV